jgi:hypothetical protein
MEIWSEEETSLSSNEIRQEAEASVLDRFLVKVAQKERANREQ